MNSKPVYRTGSSDMSVVNEDSVHYALQIFLKVFGVILCITTVNFIWGYIFGRKFRNYPPGPRGVPLLGYMPFLGKNPHKKLLELSKKYGSVFSLRLGVQNVVVLNDFKSLREAFNKPEMMYRPIPGPFEIIPHLGGIESLNGQEWLEQRRFALQSLKDSGLSKTSMENHIKDEIHHLCQKIDKSKGAPLCMKDIMYASMSNNISSLVFGRRFDYDDPRRRLLDHVVQEEAKSAAQLGLSVFFPFLRRFLLLLNRFSEVGKMMRKYFDFIEKEVSEHRKTVDSFSIRDYIDSYLLEMDKQKDRSDTSFTEWMLKCNVNTLFGAGTETVNASMQWILLIMAKHPDVQKKVQEEIDHVIGRERSPDWKDHVNLPFTHSTMMEIMRYRTVIPINLLRKTTGDVTLCGYDIPEGTIILSNLHGVHMDHSQWDQPEKFVPKRFLSADGKSVVKSDSFVPFSYGKRACPGLLLANIEVFLYFTLMMQKYKVEVVGYEDNEGHVTISWQTPDHKIRFIPRA